MKRVLAVMGATLLLLLAVQPAVAAPENSTILVYHVVQPGETLFCIARAYGVDPWAIAAENSLLDPNYITPGMVLAIPAVYRTLPPGPTCTAQTPPPAYPCTCSTTYVVVSGDTLYRISLLYGVSMWRIAECNHIYNLNYIRAGDTLCIP